MPFLGEVSPTADASARPSPLLWAPNSVSGFFPGAALSGRSRLRILACRTTGACCAFPADQRLESGKGRFSPQHDEQQQVCLTSYDARTRTRTHAHTLAVFPQTPSRTVRKHRSKGENKKIHETVAQRPKTLSCCRVFCQSLTHTFRGDSFDSFIEV